MLKNRLILALTVNDGQLCRTKRFVPDRTYSLDFVDLDGADELVVLDVTPSGRSDKFIGVVEKLSAELFLPLAVGGHVHDWSYARDLMNAGADKIVLGHGALSDRSLMQALERKLGAACLVAGVEDYWWGDGCPAYNIELCGEILVQSVARDGSLQGYDLELIGCAEKLIDRPIVAMSGCGTPAHMIEGFRWGASACATSNIFHFTKDHVAMFKSRIEAAGIPMRPMVEQIEIGG